MKGDLDVKFLGRLSSGQAVYDRYLSHLKEGLEELLPEAFSKISLSGDSFSPQVVQFDRIIGVKTCVETTDTDEIVFAQRPKRRGLTRFVKSRDGEPCQSLVVILKKIEDGDYVLITAFVGELSEKEPWDKNATEKSVEFWNSHALVWGSEEIIPGTETRDCPW